MAESISTTSAPPLSESENSTSKIPKAEESESEAESKPGDITLRIWPPSKNTREAVINRLIETLSTESMFSKRYESLQHDDAIPVAKSIEKQAYDVASSAIVLGDDVDNGLEILAAYSKEISTLVLESVKSRPVA